MEVKNQIFSSNITFGSLSSCNINKEGDLIEIYSPSELLGIINDMGKKGLTLQRYKGLGEMNPSQLWNTTMNPNNRILSKMNIQNINKTLSTYIQQLIRIIQTMIHFNLFLLQQMKY